MLVLARKFCPRDLSETRPTQTKSWRPGLSEVPIAEGQDLLLRADIARPDPAPSLAYFGGKPDPMGLSCKRSMRHVCI